MSFKNIDPNIQQILDSQKRGGIGSFFDRGFDKMLGRPINDYEVTLDSTHPVVVYGIVRKAQDGRLVLAPVSAAELPPVLEERPHALKLLRKSPAILFSNKGDIVLKAGAGVTAPVA